MQANIQLGALSIAERLYFIAEFRSGPAGFFRTAQTLIGADGARAASRQAVRADVI
jgi:hypothetical protein